MKESGTSREGARDVDLVISVLAAGSAPMLPDVARCLATNELVRARVVLVENGSAPEQGDRFVAALAPHVVDRIRQSNLGVGAGHNAGLRHADRLGARSVLLLEHDTLLDADAIAELERVHARLPEGSVLLPTLARDDSERARTYYRIGLLPPAPGGADAVGRARLTFNGLYGPMSTFRRVGPLCEQLFVAHEDTDFARRLRRLGVRHWKTRRVLGIHATIGAGRHAVEQSPLRRYYSVRNRIAVAKRHETPLDVARLVVTGLGQALRNPSPWTTITAVVDGLRGRLGPRERHDHNAARSR